MKAEGPLKVVLIETEAGNEPVRAGLKTLAAEERQTMDEDTPTIQFRWLISLPNDGGEKASRPDSACPGAGRQNN